MPVIINFSVDIFRWRKCILAAMQTVMTFQCVMMDVSTVPCAAVGATSSEGICFIAGCHRNRVYVIYLAKMQVCYLI